MFASPPICSSWQVVSAAGLAARYLNMHFRCYDPCTPFSRLAILNL